MHEDNLSKAAWHEAGHAMLAIHHGIIFSYAEIEPRDDSYGGVIYYLNPEWTYESQTETNAAGAAAEAIREGLAPGSKKYVRMVRKLFNAGANSDRLNIRLRLEKRGIIDDDQKRHAEIQIAVEVGRHLSDNYVPLQAIAQHLEDNLRITYDESVGLQGGLGRTSEGGD